LSRKLRNAAFRSARRSDSVARQQPNWWSGVPLLRSSGETIMAWTTPTLVEICVGLEINGYLPAEF
jgi:coenzyme PQQ precursor peptide PqqA